MEEGHVCPECGDELRYLPDKKSWHCDRCEKSTFPKDPQKTNPMPLKDHSTKAIWVMVIVVLSVVILTFIAAAALYILVGGIINGQTHTLTGALDFSESSTETGVFTGGFIHMSKKVDLKDVLLSIKDDSLGKYGSLEPLVDGGTVVISDGLRCSFSDINNNGELDTEDIFRIENGGSGDMMTFAYIPTGGIIALYTLI